MGLPVERERGMSFLDVPQAESNGGNRTANVRRVLALVCRWKGAWRGPSRNRNTWRLTEGNTVACRSVDSCGYADGKESGIALSGRAGRGLKMRVLVWVYGVILLPRG